MKIDKKNKFDKILFYLATITLLCYFYIYDATPVSASPDIGIRLYINNGASPIENATVFVPELRSYFKSGKDGYTPIIYGDKIPADSIGLKTITLMLYTDGYIDTVYYYVQLFDGKVRDNINIKLYEKTPNDYIPFMTFTETPSDDFTKFLFETFRR